MKRILYVLLLVLGIALSAIAQEEEEAPLVKKPPIELYKIISIDRDTTYLDTTLNIHKMYRFNYLRKDNLEVMPFSNVGQTYNKLAYNFQSNNLRPGFVAQGQHYSYKEAGEVNYYQVPTPLSDLYFKTAFNQGQQLDAFFTINTSENFNFSLAYKGVRSLGHYQHILTSTGNFELTTNYQGPNGRYRLRAHFTSQGLTSEQNGGLTESALPLFIENDSEFRDRGRIDVNFEDAENALYGNRFYIEQDYNLLRPDNAKSNIRLGGVLQHEKKSYSYRQGTAYRGFGASYLNTDLNKKTSLAESQAKAFIDLEQEYLGWLHGYINYTDYNYGYNTVLYLDDATIGNRLKGSSIEAGGKYKNEYKNFKLEAGAGAQIGGDFDGSYFYGALQVPVIDDVVLEAKASLQSSSPDYGFLLYQSDYVNYNWQTDFKNTRKQILSFNVLSNRWFNLDVSYTGIDNYTYFTIGENQDTPRPFMADDRVDYLKVKAQKEVTFGKFGAEASLVYQDVYSGTKYLSVPKILTRGSVYYQDHWFKNAMFMQAGVSAKYFSKYHMNAYDPVLGDFYVQYDEKYGAFPMVDVFFNAKVSQTRLYLVYEHVNALLSDRNTYFSAPGHPYRDAMLRFGLVWNFFQ